jgi:hypothetical protein
MESEPLLGEEDQDGGDGRATSSELDRKKGEDDYVSGSSGACVRSAGEERWAFLPGRSGR